MKSNIFKILISFFFIHVVISTSKYCSDIQLDGIFINSVNVEGTPKKGWAFSFEIDAYSINTITEGLVHSYITAKSTGQVVFESSLPFCTPDENHICSLSLEKNNKNLFGYIPAQIPEEESDDEYTLVIEIDAVDVTGSKTHTCFQKDFETHDFNIEGCGACHQVMTTYGGVPAYSNGPNQGTGNSCGGWGKWGYHYQCVEYIQRTFQIFFPVQYAKQMCGQRPAGFSHVNPPRPGDIYVTGVGTYGHTAIVAGVGAGFIDVVEENGSCSGRARYSTSMVACFLRRGGGGSPPPPPQGGGCPRYYIVQSGDSLSSIAGKFRTTVDAIVRANGIKNPNLIYVGQRLTIPC